MDREGEYADGGDHRGTVLRSEASKLMSEIDQLRADCEAFRKDAERYRWLRDKATTGKAVQLVRWMPGEMDAKVDDAMRATGAGG